MASEQINKERLNELLGIKEGQSFDDYMNDAVPDISSLRENSHEEDPTASLIAEAQAKVDEIDGKFHDSMQVIDDASRQMQQSRDSDGSASARIDSLVNVESAFKSIEDLVDSTKQMIVNVYSIISSCDVLDSETVSAAASLIGETRQLLAEYTSLYKQRVKFFDQVKLEMLKQRHRMELLQMKEEMEKRKWEMTHSEPAQAEVVSGQAVPSGSLEAGTMDMMKLLEEMDDEDDDDTADV